MVEIASNWMRRLRLKQHHIFIDAAKYSSICIFLRTRKNWIKKNVKTVLLSINFIIQIKCDFFYCCSDDILSKISHCIRLSFCEFFFIIWNEGSICTISRFQENAKCQRLPFVFDPGRNEKKKLLQDRRSSWLANEQLNSAESVPLIWV